MVSFLFSAFSKEKKISQAAIKFLDPQISTFQRCYCVDIIPKKFWDDKYVIGYIDGTIGFFIETSDIKNITPKKIGEIFFTVYRHFLKNETLNFMKKVIVFKQNQDQDYMEGHKNSAIVMDMMFGLNSFKNSQEVINAEKIYEKELSQEPAMEVILGVKLDKFSSIAAILQEMLFHQKIASRLGLN